MRFLSLHHRHASRRGGYIFLISVLIIGAIVSATTVSMVLLGLAAQQNGATIVESMQAQEYAQTCVERALQTLRSDLSYVGEKTFVFKYGTCTLSSIGGAGAEHRTICAEGQSGASTRRLEVDVSTVRPTTRIDSWREVLAFSLCS